MTGDLTIKGSMRPVTLNLVRYGEFNDSMMGHRIAYSGQGTINRKDFGMTFSMMLDGKFIVSDEIQLLLEGELVEKQPEQVTGASGESAGRLRAGSPAPRGWRVIAASRARTPEQPLTFRLADPSPNASPCGTGGLCHGENQRRSRRGASSPAREAHSRLRSSPRSMLARTASLNDMRGSGAWVCALYAAGASATLRADGARR